MNRDLRFCLGSVAAVLALVVVLVILVVAIFGAKP